MTAGIAFAYDYPSTNEWNRDGENPIRSGIGPHVNLISADFDKITLEFVMPYSYWACFEYRSDGDTSQAIDDNHYNPNLDDNLYKYVCLNNETIEKTIEANKYVEVRLAFGGERDWDFDWTSFYVSPGIISPESGEIIHKDGLLNLEARDFAAADGGVQWAVRYETCLPNTNTVAGNVDGKNNDFNWQEGIFTSGLDVSEWEVGEYCFIFNPRNGDRYTQKFNIAEPEINDPQNKKECMKGGWEEFGFRNQGQCIRFVNTGQDSR
jgi:hypothetical protein